MSAYPPDEPPVSGDMTQMHIDALRDDNRYLHSAYQDLLVQLVKVGQRARDAQFVAVLSLSLSISIGVLVAVIR